MNIVCCGLERTHTGCDSLRWVEINQESFISMFLRERELKFEASEPEGPVTSAHLGVPGSQGGGREPAAGATKSSLGGTHELRRPQQGLGRPAWVLSNHTD